MLNPEAETACFELGEGVEVCPVPLSLRSHDGRNVELNATSVVPRDQLSHRSGAVGGLFEIEEAVRVERYVR